MRNTRNWQRSLWALAVISAASGGLFLGLGEFAHSDISKYDVMLAKNERRSAEVIVKLNERGLQAVSQESLNRLFDPSIGIMSVNVFETDRSLMKVKLVNDEDTARFLADANRNPEIAYAEPNYIYHLLDAKNSADAPGEVIPDAADFAKLWGLKNTGQADPKGTPGKAGADIGATKAWVSTTGSKDIVVAVIDTGVDYTHSLLKDNIYANPGESGSGKESNGIDDDGNGFVDDFHGWNFAGVSTNNPMDDNNHGTHCSGTIGASGGADGKGIVGVNWHVSILPVKFLTGSGSGSLEDAVKAIQYATLMKVNVMSNSWGGGGFSQSMLDAITAAKAKGILFVAAAGNDGRDNDATTSPTYPSSYQVDNVISVAASTNTDGLASFSNYGKRIVHIAAPGLNVYSTIPGNKFDVYSGTSMATPHVAGASALLWSTDKNMGYAEIKDRLLRSRDYVAGFSRKLASSGRMNVYNAINKIYPVAPPEPREDQWQSLELAAPIETAHPYAANAAQEWTIQGPADAKYIRVVLGKVDVESGYDFIKVKDASGAEVDSISGKYDTYNSFYAEGNKLTLKFTSDADVNNWGFQALKYQVIY